MRFIRSSLAMKFVVKFKMEATREGQQLAESEGTSATLVNF
jgi:hypothetical protein